MSVHTRIYSVLIVVLSTLVLVLAGQDVRPFVGTWKLNRTESRSRQPIPNALLTIRAVDDGLEIRLQNITADGKAAPRVVTCHLDGKEYPLSIPDARHQTHSGTCRRVDDRTLEQVISHNNGQMVTKTRRIVSSDGQRLQEIWSGHNDQGETIDLVYVYDRQ